MWIGMSGRGGGERGQTVGWEGERVGIDRVSGVGGERVGIDRGSGVGWARKGLDRGIGGERVGTHRSGVGGGKSGDIQAEEWGGRGREWG